MKIAELQKKIANVLGVSASQKELSFEILVDKLTEILLDDITLKVPRVGYFQLKVVSANNEVPPLIFSPLSEDFSPESQNLYLTIDVSPKIKNAPEFDSNIFSIGVGKPLLPLSVDEQPDSETAYAMLRKSIEERVKELLMQSDQIPNFNIWDDYYKSPKEFDDRSAEETKTQLLDITSDLKFNAEVPSDKMPEKDKDQIDISSTTTDQTSPPDYINFLNEEDQLPNSETNLELGDLLYPSEEKRDLEYILNVTSNEEKRELEKINETTIDEETSDLDNIVIETATKENADLQNVTEIVTQENNFSALIDLELNEAPIENISISDLLDDDSSQIDDDLNITIEESEMEENIVPVGEVLPKMLEDEKDINAEVGSDNVPDHKNSSFEELHKISNEIKSVEDNEEESIEDTQIEGDGERIEWNWGDELREEFGLAADERDDARYEMIDKSEPGKEGDLELVDDFLEDENTTQDLFSRLEKTLEREFNFSEGSKPRPTHERKKLTIERNKLKKVVMEFSGPPAKYEFIEERPSEKVKRMAISLVDEDDVMNKRKFTNTDEEIRGQSKDSYFGKMFLIIFGAFIIVAAVAIFIIINGNKANIASEESKPVDRGQTNLTADSENVLNKTQLNSATKDSEALFYDDFSEFPRTATSPVPIKDATDRQILETIKKETEKLKSSNNMNESPIIKPSTPASENKIVSNAVAADTKISNRIFSDGKNYYLQVSSWPNRIRADEEVNRLRDIGFNAFIIEANLPQKGGTWYRIRVGPFRTEKETEEFMKKNNL